MIQNAFYSNSCLNTVKETMQEEVYKITDWLNTNKLSVNTGKTKLIYYTLRVYPYLTYANLTWCNIYTEQGYKK